LLIWTVVAVIGTAVVWTGSGLLESASERLSLYYRLPEIVQGAIVMAIGSSFPELATVVVSTLVHGEFELGVAAIVGSALFNIMVIPALCGLVAKDQLMTNRDLVYKEAQFYMIAVAALLLTFSFAVIYNPVESDGGALQGELTRWLAILPLVLYEI
jgi:cation:H+ antiporter